MASRSIQGRMMGFVDDLFDEKSESTFDELLTKWKVSKNEFGYWLKDKRFLKEIKRRIYWASKRGEIFVARYILTAAVKLVYLTDSKRSETARRACLDILNFSRPGRGPGRPPGRPKNPEVPSAAVSELTDQEASTILESLAKVKSSG